MANMPTKSFLTSGLTTEAQFQSAIGDFYDVVNQLGILGTAEEITITLGSIAPTKCDIIVDTEGSASTDILDLIVPTNIGEKLIFLRNKNASRAVTVSHLASGTGKIFLNTQASVVLSNPRYVIALKWDAVNSQWVEYWRNFGLFIAAGDEATIRTQLGLGTAAARNTGLLTGQIPLRENFGSAAFVNTGTGSGQIPLANQLGSLAFLSLITNSQLDGSGVTPGTYSSVTVNAQGRVTSGVGSANAANTAKAWASWDGATGALISSFGISSITKTAGGTYRVNFTTPFANTSYMALAGSEIDGAVFMQSDAGGDAVPATRCVNYTTGYVDVQTTPRGVDGGRMSVLIFSL